MNMYNYKQKYKYYKYKYLQLAGAESDATFVPPESATTDFLLELKKINGFGLLNWHKSVALNDWEGVTLDDKGRLVGLQLLGLFIKVLPESIGELYNLSYLDLSNNSLTTLPESLFNLSNLKYLDCSNNRLKRVPDSIRNLESLEHLLLDHCFGGTIHGSINVLPETIGELTKLKTLGIGSNRLDILPDFIGNLDNLEVLRADNNGLTILPDFIEKLQNLQSLDMDSNRLTTLPDSLCNLSNLHTLSFMNNRLISLPDNLGNLTSLTTLDLNSNRLTNLPLSFAVNINGRLALRPMNKIRLENNPWRSSSSYFVLSDTNTGVEHAPSMFSDEDY